MRTPPTLTILSLGGGVPVLCHRFVPGQSLPRVHREEALTKCPNASSTPSISRSLAGYNE